MRALLEVRNLSVSYEQKVVDHVSLTLGRGEVAGLIGQNGCGKSTLLRGIMGGQVKVNGQVFVRQKDFLAMRVKERARYMSMMTQRCEVMEGITTGEMIELGGYAGSHFFDGAADDARIQEIARKFCIAPLLEKDYAKLSEGQKQLVQLARLMRQDTAVVLMDEPDSALDFDNRHRIFHQIRQMIRGQEKAGLVVLHDPLCAFMYCDRILLMKDGRILDEIKPQEETSERMTQKMQALYPHMVIKKDWQHRQFYCLTEIGKD